jgi:uncharacterized protein involved in exopolysaccharide biosynthesis
LLRSFRQQPAALRATYADMLTKYDPNNQHLVETKSQLDTVNAQITEDLERINERAHQEYLFCAGEGRRPEKGGRHSAAGRRRSERELGEAAGAVAGSGFEASAL